MIIQSKLIPCPQKSREDQYQPRVPGIVTTIYSRYHPIITAESLLKMFHLRHVVHAGFVFKHLFGWHRNKSIHPPFWLIWSSKQGVGDSYTGPQMTPQHTSTSIHTHTHTHTSTHKHSALRAPSLSMDTNSATLLVAT